MSLRSVLKFGAITRFGFLLDPLDSSRSQTPSKRRLEADFLGTVLRPSFHTFGRKGLGTTRNAEGVWAQLGTWATLWATLLASSLLQCVTLHVRSSTEETQTCHVLYSKTVLLLGFSFIGITGQSRGGFFGLPEIRCGSAGRCPLLKLMGC